MKLSEVVKKVANLARYLLVDLHFDLREKRFIRHNRRLWGEKRHKPTDGEVLVEVYPVASSIIGQSYLVNCLAEKHKAAIIGYTPNKSNPLKRIYNYQFHRIYRSFNASAFFYVDINENQIEESHRRAKELMKVLKTNKDVEDLKLDGIWIGDLLYDSHLMNYRVPTIDFADPRFFSSLVGAISYFIFWRDYLDRHPVKAAVVSHCVYYENAMILRLCAARGIPVYQVSAISCYSLDQKHERANCEFTYFPEAFRKLSPKEQAEGIALAKSRLELRFKGKVGVDMFYSTKSAYGAKKSERLLAKSDKIKILIAPHCFFDSPHPYGNNLFPDFYDWLSFLGEISQLTDYEWYIKTHPDVLPGNLPVLEELIRKYPKFTRLPADSSHNQLIEEGVSVVLTVFGTVGTEYAARGIRVLNASLNNPHKAYDFNLHFGDIEKYREALMNLEKLSFPISAEKVYEHYFMYHLNKQKLFYDDYDKFIKDIGGYNAQITSAAYEYFLNEFTPEKHSRILKVLNTFIDSKDYYMNARHHELAALR